MKKFYIPYIVFCVLILTLSVININNSQKKDTQYSSNSVVQKEVKKEKNVKKDSKNTNEFYTIRANNNNIYLYDSEETEVQKLSIDYLSLREYDKNQFLSGIKVNNMQEVYQLIEDFSN